VIKLYNVTSHDQTPYIEEFKRIGFEIVNPEPQIRSVEPSFEAQVEEGKRVADLVPNDACVLIGGAQIIMEVIIWELMTKNCRFFTALSEKLINEDGSFRFNLKSVTETFFSKKIRKGKLIKSE